MIGYIESPMFNIQHSYDKEPAKILFLLKQIALNQYAFLLRKKKSLII